MLVHIHRIQCLWVCATLTGHGFGVCVNVTLQPEDMFVCDVAERDISSPPAWKKLRKSQCTPLFMNAYTMRGETPTCKDKVRM